MKSQRSYITLQMSHGQRKYLFRNLLAIWTRALEKVANRAVEYGVQDITSFKRQAQLSLTVHMLHSKIENAH